MNAPQSKPQVFQRQPTDAALDAMIQSESYIVPFDELERRYVKGEAPPEALKRVTICLIVTHSGFVVTGESCCDDPANFCAVTGRELAREEAIEKLYGYMAFARREAQLELAALRTVMIGSPEREQQVIEGSDVPNARALGL